MRIRTATIQDADAIYTIGLRCPELQTNPTQPFMETDELHWAIENPNGVFLLGEDEDGAVGFVYANMQDMERPMPGRFACLVYLAVVQAKRSNGLATQLYEATVERLRESGVATLYGWAHAGERSPIEAFLTRKGFQAGGLYRWYDRSI